MADAIDAGRHLTDRDRRVLALLAAHRVLTTEQITRVAFTSHITAQHRLATLTKRGVLARFRRCLPSGSQSWRYTLGVLGVMMNAARAGRSIPRPSRITETILALAESPKLDHLLGINDFFTRLHNQANRRDGCALVEWWSERKVAKSVGELVRPDGYGEWQESGRNVRFFVEYDNGTETLERLAGKFEGYRNLAMAGISHPILFIFAGVTRQNNFHRMASARSRDLAGLSVASTAVTDMTTDTAGDGPAGPVWLPVPSSTRRRLIDLPAPATRPRAAA
ncbi:replication-relaxation family protein [Actinokineospora iranica]|uniref:replication-relaxation family protein n=1 Tax=Actinokineospora iranica TaxID=1271860 RepID=UPI001587F05C|nr:replication-relaxation family protein [Actinokineospora iranica]